MKTRIEQIWGEHAKQSVERPMAADGIRITRLDPDSPFDIYVGIDDTQQPIFGVGVRDRPPAVALESKAFDYFRKQRAGGSWLVVLRLKRHGLEPVFGRLCQDLNDAAIAVGSEVELIALFTARLQLWERLFLGTEDALLKAHQIRGLIAELLVLEKIITSGQRPPEEAVHGWVGQESADQDFQFADAAIEVKSSLPGRRTVSISSLRQLVSQVPLKLVVIGLVGSASGSFGSTSLNSLVGRLEGIVAVSDIALATFKERLLAAGYVDHPRYDEDWFVQGDLTAFDVRFDFPRLTEDTVPGGIVTATYDLQLSILDAYRTEFYTE